MERLCIKYVLALNLAMFVLTVLPSFAGGSGSVSGIPFTDLLEEGQFSELITVPVQKIKLDNVPALELFVVTNIGPDLNNSDRSDEELPGVVATPEPTVIIFLIVSSLIVMKRWHFHENMKKRHH